VTDEGGKVGSMIFSRKPVCMPTLERCFQWDIEETMVWTSLDADTADVWSVGGARLIFQEKIVFDERERFGRTVG
jgi:hypothetical protein